MPDTLLPNPLLPDTKLQNPRPEKLIPGNLIPNSPFIKFWGFILFSLLLAFDVLAEITPYNLIAPQRQESVYLVDQAGEIAHTWQLNGLTATSAYLQPDGHLYRTVLVEDPPFQAGGFAGAVEHVDWDGQRLWKFEISNDRFLSHHDIELLPNGHVLVLSWERLTEEEVLAAGRAPGTIPENGLWSETLFELKPVGQSEAEIVWQWRLADHLVQDIDESKANFGVIAEHPERVHINYNKDATHSDWVHANAINYNAELDQIVISAHAFNEFWVIDHGTTAEEAAGSSGGKSGKGGDLLYRWGNPRTYDRGTLDDQKLFNQHDVEWIPGLFPGAGRFLLFNNGVGRPQGEYSTIDEVIPPINAEGQYELDASGRYGPATTSPVYQAEVPEDFVATFLSGAQRLRNGNTLITVGPEGQLFEVNPAGETVWEYDSIQIVNSIRRVFRADRYYLSSLTPSGMVVDETISGNWFDPERNGEGYVIEILNDGRVLLIWLTFPPQATATSQQSWMIGVGYFEGDHIVVERMETLSGTRFGSGFDKDELMAEEWGRLEMIFDGCDSGEITWSGRPGFDQGLLPMTRLTSPHELNCGSTSDTGGATPDTVDASLASEAANGSFYQPERSGEGWFMEYLGDGRALVQWFTYNLQGNQAWLTGVGRVEAERVIVDEMIYVTGAQFGAGFDDSEITIQTWGSFEFEFDDCDTGRIRYASQLAGWGAGEVEMKRLTNIKGIECDWPGE
jgi:hypothetical protein